MAHRVAPISVSIALGHASANAVKATVGAGPLVAPRVYFSHTILICRAPDEKALSTIFGLWYGSAWARIHDLPVVRQTLYHWAITPVFQKL